MQCQIQLMEDLCLSGRCLQQLDLVHWQSARDIAPLIISIIIWTIGEMIFFPVTAAYASEIAPPKKRGEYMGYFQMTFSFAFSAGPWLGAVVYEKYGSVVLWCGALAMGLITAALVLFLKEKQSAAA